MAIPTPHISAKKEDIAKTVLMPGDPLRSEFIAKTFLKNPVLVNDVRGVHGYTGEYNGKKVKFKGIIANDPRLPKNSTIIGRHVMTCCVDDIQYSGMICVFKNEVKLKSIYE